MIALGGGATGAERTEPGVGIVSGGGGGPFAMVFVALGSGGGAGRGPISAEG